jgi:hypothetical protein
MQYFQFIIDASLMSTCSGSRLRTRTASDNESFNADLLVNWDNK